MRTIDLFMSYWTNQDEFLPMLLELIFNLPALIALLFTVLSIYWAYRLVRVLIVHFGYKHDQTYAIDATPTANIDNYLTYELNFIAHDLYRKISSTYEKK